MKSGIPVFLGMRMGIEDTDFLDIIFTNSAKSIKFGGYIIEHFS